NPKTGRQEEAGGGAGQPWRLALLLTAVGIDLKAANLRVEAGAEAPRFSEGACHDRVGLLRHAGNHRPGNHVSATDQVLRVTLRRPSADGRDPDSDDLGLLPC